MDHVRTAAHSYIVLIVMLIISESLGRTPSDYMAAIAQAEIAWISRYARPRQGRDFEQTGHPPSAHIELLERYIRAVKAPGIAPYDSDLFQSVIWHPDLHSGNIITTPDVGRPMELLGLIDWQHSCLIPACLATPIPSAFVYQGDLIAMPAGFDMPALPDDYETLSEGAKARVTWELKMAALHKGYSIIVARHPFRQRLARTPSRNLLILAAKAADTCWVENFIQLRYTLAELQCKWSGLCDEPVGFTMEELKEAVRVSRLPDQYEANCAAVFSELECGEDGVMSRATQDQVDAARSLCKDMAAQWDEAEFGGPFPLRPRPRSQLFLVRSGTILYIVTVPLYGLRTVASTH